MIKLTIIQVLQWNTVVEILSHKKLLSDLQKAFISRNKHMGIDKMSRVMKTMRKSKASA